MTTNTKSNSIDPLPILDARAMAPSGSPPNPGRGVPAAIEMRDLSRRPTLAKAGETKARLRPAHRARLRQASKALRIALPVALLVFWEVGCEAGLISPRILDSPATVVTAFQHLISTHQLQDALSISLRRAGVGLAFGLLIGLSFGLISGLSRLGEKLFDSSMQMFRMIPFLAVIPLVVVWFGIGETAKVVLITFACVFPVYINTYAAVRSIDPKLIEAARVFGLRGWGLTRTVIIPNAMPGILVGVRFSMGVSVLALIAAEQINADSGLGYLVSNAQDAFRNDIIIALVLVYAVLGLLIDLFIRIFERVLLPWRASLVAS